MIDKQHMKDRMREGKLYIASHLPPEDEIKEACLDRFNNAPRSEAAVRTEYLRPMLGGMGKNCYIEPRLHVDHGYNVFLGDNVYFNTGCIILDQCPITIGDNTLFGPRVSLLGALHPIDAAIRNLLVEGGKPITIGKDCWFGGDVTVCPGVSVGDGTVIGAGSVITKDIPANVIAVGNPCKVLRPITEEDHKYWKAQLDEFTSDTGISFPEIS